MAGVDRVMIRSTIVPTLVLLQALPQLQLDTPHTHSKSHSMNAGSTTRAFRRRRREPPSSHATAALRSSCSPAPLTASQAKALPSASDVALGATSGGPEPGCIATRPATSGTAASGEVSSTPAVPCAAGLVPHAGAAAVLSAGGTAVEPTVLTGPWRAPRARLRAKRALTAADVAGACGTAGGA